MVDEPAVEPVVSEQTALTAEDAERTAVNSELPGEQTKKNWFVKLWTAKAPEDAPAELAGAASGGAPDLDKLTAAGLGLLSSRRP